MSLLIPVYKNKIINNTEIALTTVARFMIYNSTLIIYVAIGRYATCSLIRHKIIVACPFRLNYFRIAFIETFDTELVTADLII